MQNAANASSASPIEDATPSCFAKTSAAKSSRFLIHCRGRSRRSTAPVRSTAAILVRGGGFAMVVGPGRPAAMEHPSAIRPERHAVFDAAKMGKATLFRSERLMVGLNCFEPGQEHA